MIILSHSRTGSQIKGDIQLENKVAQTCYSSKESGISQPAC